MTPLRARSMTRPSSWAAGSPSAERRRRSRQGGFRHRRRRRDEVLDAVRLARFCASVRVGATRGRRRLPQLAAGLRPGRATGAAHPQCRWGAATQVSRWKRFASRRARRPISSSRRTPAAKPRSGRSTACCAVRNGDLTIDTDPARRDQDLFRAPRSAPLDPGVEGADAPGADLSELRGAIVFVGASAAHAVGHRRDAVVALDAGRRSPCADPRAGLERRNAESARIGPRRGVDGDGRALRGARGDDLGLGPAVRRARIRRCGLRDRRSELVRVCATRSFSSIRPIPRFPPPRSISPASRRFMR